MTATQPSLSDGYATQFGALMAELRAAGSLLVAYSGGVDSTFLAVTAHDVLGARALAVTAASETYPVWERREAEALARQFGFAHRIIETSELAIPGYRDNPPERCYHCKTALFSELRRLADTEGFAQIADGTTVDDLSDFRPGRRAAREAGVISPLVNAGLTKADVRQLSRRRGLPTADKASFACLASRVPYGESITAEKLRQIDAAEQFFRERGFHQCRVRHHGTVARIEIEPADETRLLQTVRSEAIQHLKALGFRFITFDLEGYRTGSMNP